MSEWVRVEERMPPAYTEVWVFRAPRGGSRRVEAYYVGRPRECVEDDGITHWQPLVKPENPRD